MLERTIGKLFRRGISGLILMLIGVLATIQAPVTPMAAQAAEQIVYLIDFNGTLASYDLATGARIRPVFTATSEQRALGVVRGPDGRIYVIVSGAILRYDGATGAYIDTIVSADGRRFIASIAFGSDGNLYVLEDPEAPSSDRVRIRRVRPADGADLGVVADNLRTPYPLPGTPRLNTPGQIAFDTAGRLYLLDNTANLLVRYDPGVRAFTETLIGPDERIFYGSAFTFGADGSIYVSEGLVASLTNRPRRIFRYSAAGAFRDTFTDVTPWPSSLGFGPGGDLFALSSDALLRFDGRTGALIGTVVAGTFPADGGVTLGPHAFAFAASGVAAPPRVNPAFVTVAQRATPALEVQRGGIVTTRIVATNHGRGMAQDVLITLPLDPARVRVLDAQLSRPGAWVSRLSADELELRTGALGSRGDTITATVRLAVAAEAADGLLFGEPLTFRWRDAAGGGSGTGNAVPLMIAGADRDAATLELTATPPSAPAGSSHTFSGTVFLPNEPVALWYNTPDGRAVALARSNADAAGALAVTLATEGFTPGSYTLVAEGIWSGVTAVGAFAVER
jgi:streptogramin lyase